MNEPEKVKKAEVYGIPYYVCPNCRNNVFKLTSEKFCKYCGQALLWEDKPTKTN